jgi:hypothetical protein
MGDPLLKAYSVLMLDEVHERTAQIDIIMGKNKFFFRIRIDRNWFVFSGSGSGSRDVWVWQKLTLFPVILLPNFSLMLFVLALGCEILKKGEKKEKLLCGRWHSPDPDTGGYASACTLKIRIRIYFYRFPILTIRIRTNKARYTGCKYYLQSHNPTIVPFVNKKFDPKTCDPETLGLLITGRDFQENLTQLFHLTVDLADWILSGSVFWVWQNDGGSASVLINFIFLDYFIFSIDYVGNFQCCGSGSGADPDLVGYPSLEVQDPDPYPDPQHWYF